MIILDYRRYGNEKLDGFKWRWQNRWCGEIDSTEMMYAEEMLCTSREEHEALFGNAGDFEDDTKEDFEIDAMAAGLDVDELELMDPDDRAEALEEAGLDPDDYDFD